mmetsp:Transcript_14050/g.15380  ORF Transcript_14050/g.15380 Transcript_14050/m.15380 type:complete len:85 (+) Transcript_14050:1066-1320(+)
MHKNQSVFIPQIIPVIIRHGIFTFNTLLLFSNFLSCFDSNDAESFNGSDGSSFRLNDSFDGGIVNGSGTYVYTNENTDENSDEL